MTIPELLERITFKFKSDLDLLIAKNQDYAGEDPLDNLRDFGFLGIVVRTGDKYKRLKNFSQRGNLTVKSESIRDTLRDLRNYAFLAEVVLDEAEEKVRKFEE